MFIKLQSGHVKSGMTLKLYLQQAGTDYSTYNYWRKKYCASGDRFREIAPIPLLPISKGIAGPSLLSEVLLQKYEYHVPYYRQIQHLYKIEHMCDDADLSFDERRRKRQELARPIMETMKLWMETEAIPEQRDCRHAVQVQGDDGGTAGDAAA